MAISNTYNAAADLLQRNLGADRTNKIAYIDDNGRYSYGELADLAGRFANALKRLDVTQEQRILLALHDSIDFPVAFLGAIQAGIVPVCVNTLLTTQDYDYMLRDSRAQVLVVSEALLPVFAPIVEKGLPRLYSMLLAKAAEAGLTPETEGSWVKSLDEFKLEVVTQRMSAPERVLPQSGIAKNELIESLQQSRQALITAVSEAAACRS